MNLRQKLSLCYRILRQKPGNLLAHAEREPPKADDPMQLSMNQQLKELVWVFATHGHSGFSASYARRLLDLLLSYKLIGPLTGEDSEWGEPFDEAGTRQNRRCGHVFKGADGLTYDSNGRVFREPSGACYTSRDSRVIITFPYTPTTEYVDVPADADN